VEVGAENGTKEVFDAVVSTMPVPQLLLLKNIDNILQGNQIASLELVISQLQLL